MNEERLQWCFEHKKEYKIIIDYMVKNSLTNYCGNSLEDYKNLLRNCEKDIDNLKKLMI